MIPSLSTHSAQLERWLGKDQCERLSESMKDWYGPPIAVSGVPGKVYIHKGGDFRGGIRSGVFASAMDRMDELCVQAKHRWRRASRSKQLNAGFASLSELIAEASGAKRVNFIFQKTGSTGVIAVTNSLYRLGAMPVAGSAPANAPGGTAPVDSDAAYPTFTNPTGGDTLHFVRAEAVATVAGNTLLLYDHIFGVNKTMNSTATEAVTGVPTRYQSTTGGAIDSAEGNFLFIQVGGTALAATAHNWTVCQYTDQGGTTAVSLPSLTGNSGAIVDRLDHPTGQWFAPLASGDTGIKALTQMQCSAAVATGVVWFMMGHPIAFCPCPVANLVCVVDGINTALNLTRIFDDAALQLLEVTKPATTATTYNLNVFAVAS